MGEILDTAVDKIGTLLTIIVLSVGGIAQWWAITLILLPQILIPLLILYKRNEGIKIHPTRIGKLSMAATWVTIIGFLLAKATEIADTPIAIAALYVFVLLSFALGSYALWQYATGRDQH